MSVERAARRRERLFRSQDGICPACRLPLPGDLAGAEVDHIIPRSRGGPDLLWNRRLVHFKCNRDKGTGLTDEAVALAAEHGVILREPPVRVRKHWRDWVPGVPGWLAAGEFARDN